MNKIAARISRPLEEKLSLPISGEHISAREEERRSIAREIHDDLGQALAALKMDVSLLKQKLAKTHQEVTLGELFEEAQRIEAQVDKAIGAVHRVIADLRPETVSHLGLSGAIKWQVNEFQERTGIPVEIRFDLEQITLRETSKATVLFRIFQELLTNIGRHARASRVEATLRHENEFFLMEIKDNGRGLNRSDIEKATSFGLMGLRERVGLLEGELEIQGFPNKGTTAKVRIPLPVLMMSKNR